MNPKKPIGLVIGDEADLSEEFIEENQIEVVEFVVNFPEEIEGEEIPGETFYQKMKNAKEPPTTSQPPLPKFKRAFLKAYEKFDDVLVILISGELSKAVSTAEMAKDQLPIKDKIHIFDSRLTSAGEALLIWKAQEMISQGKGIKEILSSLNSLKDQIKCFGLLQDIRWIEKGGRLPPLMAKPLRSLQRIGFQVSIGIKDGKIVPLGLKFTGKERASAVLRVLEGASKVKAEVEVKVAIAHAEVSKEELEEIKDGIAKMKAKLLFVEVLNPIIGAHSGPGSLIIAYL
jgi:DegV family protein with EDD domain